MFGWMFPAKKTASSTPQRTTTPDKKDADRPISSKTVEKETRQREDRPEPAVFDVTSPKLYVGNLSFDAVESDLFDLFSKVGAVKNVEIAKDRYTDRSKGFGFVEMETLDTAKAAAQKLDRTDFMARQIRVNGAKADKRVGEQRPAANGAAVEGSSPSNV
jgi:RNA recognition motif-containing protein